MCGVLVIDKVRIVVAVDGAPVFELRELFPQVRHCGGFQIRRGTYIRLWFCLSWKNNMKNSSRGICAKQYKRIHNNRKKSSRTKQRDDLSRAEVKGRHGGHLYSTPTLQARKEKKGYKL
jgi:hypothetical protein